MFNLQHKAFISICLLAANLAWQVPACLSQSPLGQSDWQTLNQSPNQQSQSSQPLGQSEWQNPGGSGQGFNQVPGVTNNPANNNNAPPAYSQGGGPGSNLGQSPWQTPNAGTNQYQSNNQPSWQSNPNSGLGLSPWQQPQNSVQTNVNQNPSSPDYYYGQVNQNQPNPNAFNAGQYQGQANYSAQPNNQWSGNLPPASSIPPEQGQTQAQPQSSGGLKKTLAGITKAAAQAAGMGLGVAAPFAGVYMMTRAMSTPTTTMMPTMPYGYGGMPTMMPYSMPNYGMMNMAPMYSSALSGLSSFMTH